MSNFVECLFYLLRYHEKPATNDGGASFGSVERSEPLTRPVPDGVAPIRAAAPRPGLVPAGDSGRGCYRIEDGLLKVTMVSSSGSERFLAFLGRGAIVGELSIIDGLPRSASVVVVRNATMSFLSRAAFEAFRPKHPELFKALARLLAKRLRETDALVAAGSFLSLRGRAARTLLDLAEHFGKEVAPGPDRPVRRSVRATSPPWPALRAKTSEFSLARGYYYLENKPQIEKQVIP